MRQYLVDHALQNVWCNPEQDNQLIFAAMKITKPNGELNRFKLMNRDVALPTQGKRYHVFQIGQLYPRVIGLLPKRPIWANEAWINFADAINTNKVLLTVYTAEGLCIPNYSVYYMYSNERDLVFAIEVNPTLPVNYDTTQVYLRLYTNAYYKTYRADATLDYMYCKGVSPKTVQDILDIQALVTNYRTKAGHVSCYSDGFLVKDISPLTAKVGGSIEFIYDSSVKRVVTFTVNNLKTFESILDNKYKYLLHHLDGGNDTIDFQDDIDIHVIADTQIGRHKGYYYHRNNIDSHRMVTHRDYSVVVDYFNYTAGKLKEAVNLPTADVRDFKLQVTIRNSGYYRPLIYDNNRIFELYKLSDDKVLQAMTGVTSSLPLWRAENLEASAYTELMRSKYKDVDMALVQKAYGYNGISKVIGNTPEITTWASSKPFTKIPVALQDNCTVYEYDEKGYLLGYNYHVSGSDYYAANNLTRLVEVISGQGTVKPDVRFGTDNIPLPSYHNYRVYRCMVNNGQVDNNWVDITGTTEYTVVNNILVYGNEQYDQFLMVRTDKTFLAYDIDVTPVNGNFFFSFAEKEDRGNGKLDYLVPVPLGELDVFMNGKSLIQGLDYIVKFPQIFILNKSHLKHPIDTSVQKVHVRYTGFCSKDLVSDKPDDYGFIEHGYLSNNNRYDIRDDKVLRITVDGSNLHRNSLLFSEEHDGISILDPDNGKPYQIKDIIVPLKQLTDENTYTLRNKSIIIDEAVSGYMTVKLPQSPRGSMQAIVKKYALISPFMTRMINALRDKEITDIQLIAATSDNDILNLCHPFESVLAYDPINDDNEFDFRYIAVHPHPYNAPVNVNLYQYKFLVKVAKLYGRNLIDISSFITFTS